jgi:hypothetical protein
MINKRTNVSIALLYPASTASPLPSLTGMPYLRLRAEYYVYPPLSLSPVHMEQRSSASLPKAEGRTIARNCILETWLTWDGSRARDDRFAMSHTQAANQNAYILPIVACGIFPSDQIGSGWVDR